MPMPGSKSRRAGIWHRFRQPLLFDLEMDFDNRLPAASDAIADTLDYKAISKRLIAYVSQSQFGLVESLAERCADIVLREFNVARVRLKLSKPGAVRGARAVGVIIERNRDALAQGDLLFRRGHEPVELPESVAALAKPVRAPRRRTARPRGGRCPAYLSLGSNIEPERNLRTAIAALRARFGEVLVSPVYRTAAVGFDGPDFLNAVAMIESDIHPFALNDWLHALEEAQGRDRRDASYSNRPLDIDIIYFGDLILDGPGDFTLPRPELRHAFVLKPLADIAPHFVDPVRGASLETLWNSHPDRDNPPQEVALQL